MIEKETLNLLRKSLNWCILQVKSLNKILELNVLVLFHRLHDSRAKMCLLLHLIGLSLEHLLYLLLLLCILQDQSLSLLVSLIKNFEKLLDLILIITCPQEVLSLVVEQIILLACLGKFCLYLFGLISCFNDLFLQKHLLSFLFVHLQFLFFDCFLVQLRHIPQEECLLSDLAELAFKSFDLLLF